MLALTQVSTSWPLAPSPAPQASEKLVEQLVPRHLRHIGGAQPVGAQERLRPLRAKVVGHRARPDERNEPMIRHLVSYTRYALSTLSTIAFAVN